MNAEYKQIVLSGLQRLITLRLAGHPPMDAMRSVGEIWLDALYSCGDWGDQRHLVGLEQAFKTAESEIDRFPSPAEIRRRKPQVIDTVKILPTLPKSNAEQAEIDQIMKEIFNTLDINNEEA